MLLSVTPCGRASDDEGQGCERDTQWTDKRHTEGEEESSACDDYALLWIGITTSHIRYVSMLADM